jgi:ABC-type sugar transport system permease subunit
MARSEQIVAPVAGRPLVGRRARWSAQQREEARFALVLILPAMLTVALIAFLPLARAFWLSLFKVNLRFANSPRTFQGIGNYVAILGDDRFHNALRVTGIIAGTSLVAEMVLGMVIALTINRQFFGRGLVRAAILVPWALTTVVAAKMWQLIYQADYGVFNRLLNDLHILHGYLPWIADPQVALWAMIGADIWKTTPFMALLLLAGLQLIPQDVYESAAMDGSNAWQRFWRITVPLLKPTILVALLFRLIDVARMFDLPFVLTNGGPGFETETVTLYTYRTLFQNLQFGTGSALAFLTFLIVVVISYLFIKVLGAPAGGAGGGR